MADRAIRSKSNLAKIVKNVALAMAIWVVAVRTVAGRSCGSEFDDLASRTVLATTVFEGRAENVSEIAGDSDTDAALYSVVFRVRHVFKGTMEKRLNAKNNADVYRLVTVGKFGANSDDGACVGSVTLGGVYVLFVGERIGGGGAGQKKVFYENTALPVEATDDVRKTMEDSSCPKCGKNSFVFFANV